jgi:SAM-dependent MidA family methyltransferase
MPIEAPDPLSLRLTQLIADRIAADPAGHVTFATFMDWVLYEPDLGYYSRADRYALPSDFITSPHVSHDFAALLAGQFVQMWQLLGSPADFTLLEVGAGSGVLARDLLISIRTQYPEFARVLTYMIAERSSGLQRSQQEQLQSQGVTWVELNDLSSSSLTGCIFSNELVDALPVHLVTIQQGQLQEIYVSTQQEGERIGFQEEVGELSTPRLQQYFVDLGIDFPSPIYPEGYRTEVGLKALDWLDTVASLLQKGYLLTMDYGHPASRYYHPNRPQGTLMAYRRHQMQADPYQRIGQQDLTAHVNFSALEAYGKPLGLQPLGLVTQEKFLSALGILERLATLSSDTTVHPHQILAQRQGLHLLMDPLGLGGFYVLIQGKDLNAPHEMKLRGLGGYPAVPSSINSSL